MKHIYIKCCFAIILVGGSILFYYRFLDGTMFDLVNNSQKPRVYQTVKSSYKVGDDVVAYASAFCKYRNTPATVQWYLEDDVILSYPAKQTNFPIKCYSANDLIEIGVIPGYIGNHTYKFVGKVIYHLPFRDVTIELSTNSFYVSPLSK